MFKMNWFTKVLKVKPVPNKIVWWIGTDAVKLVWNYPMDFINRIRLFNYRIFWKIAHRRFNEHWVNCYNLGRALNDFGIPQEKIRIKPMGYEKIIVDKKPDSFKILFYINQRGKYHTDKNYRKRIDYFYGKRYYDYLQVHYDTVLIDGNADMKKVLKEVSCYIKVNATPYNDINRVGKQCLDNDIPVYVIEDWKNDFYDNIYKVIKWINIKKDTFNTSK